MDDQQRVRLIILSVSGLLFGAGGYGYYWYQEQKAASQAEAEQVVSVRPAVRKQPVKPQTIATASTVPASGAAADSAATTKLAVQTTSDKPAAATADGARSSAATKPALAITTSPVTAPPAANTRQTAAQPAQPIASAPPAQPAPAAVTAQTKAQPATAPAAKPAVARPVTAQAPAAAPAAPGSATAPATASAPATPATAAAPAATNGATAQAASPAATPPAVAKNSKHYPATTQEYALAMAAIGKGRQNPVEPNGTYKQWPLNTRAMNKDDDSMVPPPPLDSPEEKIKPAPTKIKNEKLVPPPPPMQATPTSTLANDPLGGIDISQLPPPPSRPTIGDKVKVLAVFDDKAIISFPRAMLQKNHWPRTITLAKGEQFESLTVVSIDRDGVTFEEDGERSLKPIATIK